MASAEHSNGSDSMIAFTFNSLDAECFAHARALCTAEHRATNDSRRMSTWRALMVQRNRETTCGTTAAADTG